MFYIERKKNQKHFNCPKCECHMLKFGTKKEYAYCPLCKEDYEVV